VERRNMDGQERGDELEVKIHLADRRHIPSKQFCNSFGGGMICNIECQQQSTERITSLASACLQEGLDMNKALRSALQRE
jgi:hypothetical protein